MELKDFRTLLEIGKTGSISLAARSLYVSQPGLSQFLHTYEQQLGFPIFERVSHGVRPTVKGRAYLDLIRGIVEEYDTGIMELKSGGQRKIRFGIGDQRGSLLIPTIMSMMDSMKPEFELEINDAISSRNNLIDALRKCEADAACTTVIDEDYSRNAGILCYPLVKEEIMLVLPKGHPLTGSLHQRGNGDYWVNPPALDGQNYILCSAKREIRRMSDQIFHSLGIRNIRVLQSSTSLFTVINSCLNCNALTFSPWEYVCHSSQCVCASIGENGFYWTHILMARKEAFQKNELDILMWMLRESLLQDMDNRHVVAEV